jgi:hypothetical protein
MGTRIVDELPYYTHISSKKHDQLKKIMNTMNLPKEEWYYELIGMHHFTIYFKKQEYLSWFLLQGK